MGAAESRRMLTALVRHVGTDAAARVWPDGPFAPRRPSAQLVLTTVDTHSVRVEAERLGALVRATDAIVSIGSGDVASWVAHPGLRAAIWKRWSELLTECAVVVRFDLADGFRIVEACLGELAATVRWTGAVRDESGELRSTPLPAPVLAAADTLLGRLLAEVAATAPDPFRLMRLYEITAIADALEGGSEDRWERVHARLVRDASPELAEAAAALLESRTKPDRASLELMRLLGSLDDADALLGAAVRWGDRHPKVVEVVASGMIAQRRAIEARFWLSEGRRLHPSHAAWNALEAEL
jgi:hypothetical protein